MLFLCQGNCPLCKTFISNVQEGMEARPYTVRVNLYKTVGNESRADGNVFYALYVYIYLY